jgi:glycoside/pentoside/hexuronide:cation symporter, GPH family
MRRSILLAYALPALIVALPTIPVYILLPPFYGIELGLGLATTGFVLLGARLFDTVSDPIIGMLSDRLSFRGNHRKPWIASGAVIAGAGLYMVLNPPAGIGAGYLLGWSLLLYAGWTMVSVPYMAWGAELSADYNERTRITAWREGVGLLGLVGAGALISFATSMGWSEADSTGALAVFAIVLGVIAFPIMLYLVPEKPGAPTLRRSTMHGTPSQALRTLVRNKPFARLLAAWFLNGLANGVPAALFFIYLEHGLGADVQQRPLFILIYFVAAVVAIPAWKFAKHRTWCGAMALAATAFATVPWIGQGDLLAFGVVCVITGLALGADLVIPPAIQADVVDYGALQSGEARTGLLFALWGMSTKLALALAVGLSLPGLEIAGFSPETPGEEGRRALAVIYALGPAVIKLTVIALIWRFPLTAEKHGVIRRALDRREARLNRTQEPAL